MKTCNKCYASKDKKEFHKSIRNPDGLDYWCKHCRSEYKKTPICKARDAEYQKSPAVKTRLSEYRKTLAYRAWYASYMSKYVRTESSKAKQIEYQRTPARKAYQLEYRKRPEVVARHARYLEERKKNGEYKAYQLKRQQTQEYKKSLAKWAQSPKGRYSVYKRGAKKRGLPFELTMEQFMMFWNKPCRYCGKKIDGIGIDRMENDKGYVIGNVTACCTEHNIAKQDMDEHQFIASCQAVVDHCKKQGELNNV